MQFGGGHGGRVPPLFQTGGTEYAMSTPLFPFRFCIWRGFKYKNEVCRVLGEELCMLHGRPYKAKLMLKQSLVWYH